MATSPIGSRPPTPIQNFDYYSANSNTVVQQDRSPPNKDGKVYPPPISISAESRKKSELTQQLAAYESQKSTGKVSSIGENKQNQKTDFNEILRISTPSTLFPNLRGIPIPNQLTNEQKTNVRRLLQQYNPEFITSHPVVNSCGDPIHLEVDLNSAKDAFSFTPYRLTDDQKKTISTIFHDYPTHLKWLNEHVEIRTIGPREVPEKALEGQQGVFLKKSVKGEIFVMMFEIMLLTDKEDIENDKNLRKLAECDNYYDRSVSDKNYVSEGMGISMKLNAATGRRFYDFDSARTNLDAISINAINSETGEQLKLNLFKTNRDVLEGEQLCYLYFINSNR